SPGCWSRCPAATTTAAVALASASRSAVRREVDEHGRHWAGSPATSYHGHRSLAEEDAMKTLEDVQTWRGMKVVDADGDKIGTIEDIYLDRQTGEPEWATVKTGIFGRKVSFVPI